MKRINDLSIISSLYPVYFTQEMKLAEHLLYVGPIATPHAFGSH